MASPLSLLQHIGTAIIGFFKKEAPVVNEVIKEGAQLALEVEPFADLLLGPTAPLYNMTVAAVVQAEATGQAVLAGATGGGAQKLAAVFAGLEPGFVAYYEKEFGATPTEAQIVAYINAVVASLNALPAPPAKAA